MAAVEDEHAAMAATTAAYADHQRHLLQAIAGGGGTTANLASNLPTTMAAMGAQASAPCSHSSHVLRGGRGCMDHPGASTGH